MEQCDPPRLLGRQLWKHLENYYVGLRQKHPKVHNLQIVNGLVIKSNSKNIYGVIKMYKHIYFSHKSQ